MADEVVHFEIPADNVERAQDFYRTLFGWSVNGTPGVGYTLLGTTPSGKDGAPTEPGAINGGMLARQKPITSPVITIEVKSIDESLKRIGTPDGSSRPREAARRRHGARRLFRGQRGQRPGSLADRLMASPFPGPWKGRSAVDSVSQASYGLTSRAA